MILKDSGEGCKKKNNINSTIKLELAYSPASIHNMSHIGNSNPWVPIHPILIGPIDNLHIGNLDM